MRTKSTSLMTRRRSCSTTLIQRLSRSSLFFHSVFTVLPKFARVPRGNDNGLTVSGDEYDFVGDLQSVSVCHFSVFSSVHPLTSMSIQVIPLGPHLMDSFISPAHHHMSICLGSPSTATRRRQHSHSTSICGSHPSSRPSRSPPVEPLHHSYATLKIARSTRTRRNQPHTRSALSQSMVTSPASSTTVDLRTLGRGSSDTLSRSSSSTSLAALQSHLGARRAVRS